MTVYKSVDVLDLTSPNRDGNGSITFKRLATTMDTKIGKRRFDDHVGHSLPEHMFSWFCASRTEVASLRSWLDVRRGRVIPFWVPTYSQDLVLTGDVTATSTSITVVDAGYTKHLFSHLARRYVTFILPDGSFTTIRKITGATNNGDGTETLTVDSALPAITAATTIVSFLVYTRLADDMAKIVWHNHDLAECTLKFVEIPTEVPA